MRIINDLINMEDLRQERPNNSPIMKLNKRLEQTSVNNKFGVQVKDSMAFQA